MRFCPYCGSAVEEGQNTCTNCKKPYPQFEQAEKSAIEKIPSQEVQPAMEQATERNKNGKAIIKRALIGVLSVVVLFFGWTAFSGNRAAKNYSAAIREYEKGNYYAAKELFDKVPFGYGSKFRYDILCDGHIEKSSRHRR